MNDILRISDAGGKVVFAVRFDGQVCWTKDGCFVQAETSKELGKSMAQALRLLNQLNDDLLIENRGS